MRKGKVFMKCPNCRNEVDDNLKECVYCGVYLEGVAEENVSKEVSEEDKKGEGKIVFFFRNVFAAFMWVVTIYLAFLWYQNYSSEKKLYTKIYQEAVKEVRDHLNASNVKVADYDKDNVVLQRWEYHDFGDGNLRYARFAVTVPIEYDSISGHWEQEPTINVYYYTSDQNVSDGVDSSIPDYIYTPDMFMDPTNFIWE